MKPPIESSQNPANGLPAATKKPSDIEPPKEPFINLTDTGPVNPAKFQRFIVPMEFIEKANALDLAHLGTDEQDVPAPEPVPVPVPARVNTRRLPVPIPVPEPASVPEPLPVPVPEATSVPPNTANPILPNSRAQAHSAVLPPHTAKPQLQATARMAARRPVGVFAQWSLTGNMPARMKVGMAAIVALLVALLLSYTHWRSSTPSPVSNEMSGSPTVPSVAVSNSVSPPPAAIARTKAVRSNAEPAAPPAPPKTSVNQPEADDSASPSRAQPERASSKAAPSPKTTSGSATKTTLHTSSTKGVTQETPPASSEVSPPTKTLLLPSQ